MNIYIVLENYQDGDGEDWSHWVSQEVKSYHASLEGAQARVQELLEEQIAKIPQLKVFNGHLEESYWERKIADTKRNRTYLCTGSDMENVGEYDWYVIRPVEVLP